MKKILTIMASLLLTAIVVRSQAPGIFNYQGVARNSVGNALINKTITLRLTIHDATAVGAVVYQESRLATTNPFGLFNIQVGSPGATSVTGTIAGVNWGVNAKFIQVEIDPNGGSTFINIGTAQIASVPYAWFSTLSGDLVLPFNKTQADNGTLFKITNSGNASGSTALEGATNSTAANAFAIIGSVTSGTPGSNSTGVRGMNGGTGALGIGVWGSHAGGGWGVYGTSVNGRGVFGQSSAGIGLYGSTTSGKALRTDGAIQFTGINEALNRILASDALGNGTWQDPSFIGIVTGSGTLNFLPKWTPTGTNLGNSQVFDNGTNVGIGTTTPTAKFSINELFKVTATGTVQYANSVNPMMIMFETGTANADRMVIGHSPGFPTWGLQYQDAPDKFNFLSAGTPVLTADLGNQRVGVGTISPAQKLHVNSGTSFSTLLLEAQDGGNAGPHLQFLSGGEFSYIDYIRTDYPFAGFAHRQGSMEFRGGTRLNFYPTNNVGATDLAMTVITNGNVGVGNTTPGAKFHVVNTSAGPLSSVIVNQSNAANTAIGVNIFNANINSVAYGNGAVTVQRGAGSLAATYLYTGIATAITGIAASPVGFGVQGTSESGYGVTGLSYSGISVHGINLNSGNAARFENALNAGNTAPVVFVNNISTVAGVYGVHSIIASTSPGGSSTALRGQNNGLGGSGIGVYGSQNGSGWGVLGTAPSGLGVYGFTSDGVGVWGEASNNGWGVRAIANTNTAIFSTSNTGWAGDFRSQMNYAGLFQTTNIGNNIATLVSVNGSPQSFARALYAQGSGYSGYFYVPGQVAEYQSNGSSGVVSISTNGNAMVTATETGNGLYSQILNTVGFGNAAVLGVSGNPNSHGLYGIAPNGGIGRALVTSGPLQLTGIGEANNRVLASDPVGNATWKTLASIGAVSGSGTLNFVPKWTPSGTNLGNSQIFDNGFAVGIGPAAPVWNLDVASNVTVLRLRDLDDATEIDMVAAGFGYTGGFGTPLNVDIPLYTNNIDRLTVKAGTGDVGIGTATTTARLEVLQTGLTGVINATNSNVANLSNGISTINVNATAGATNPTTGGGAALFARKGAPLGTFLVNPTSIYATTSNAGTVAVAGFGGAGSYGVAGLAASAGAVGVLGETFTPGTTGIFALSGAGATALLTSGAIRLANIGEANGYVLTSDAVGNATWQYLVPPPVGISLKNLTVAQSIPSGIFTTITTWATVEYEDGGANFNGVTGEYTITVAGFYHMEAAVDWLTFGSPASVIYADITVNGIIAAGNFSNQTPAGNFTSSTHVAYEKKLNVGDLVKVRAYQNSGAAVLLDGVDNSTRFSIRLLK